MLKIRAVKIEIHTNKSPFVGEYHFQNGLNIIKGRNTAGKSTLFQSILYGLGMEELLGAKGEKTMQSALKDEIEYPSNNFNTVLESTVFLEVENNNKIITTQRVIKGNRSSKLIRVYNGAVLTEKSIYKFTDTWVHDSGGASNLEHGFHSILENFLGWDLPEVSYSQGGFNKLYIQTIFASFFIEQKSGWTDYLANIPYFGVRNAQSRSVEFLLNLDVFENELKRQQVKEEKSTLLTKWKFLFEEFESISKRSGISVSNISNMPEIISQTIPNAITVYTEGVQKTLDDVLYTWQQELKSLENKPFENVNKNLLANHNQQIANLQNQLAEKQFVADLLNQKLRTARQSLSHYKGHLSEIRTELNQNKDAQKIYKLGGEKDVKIANQECPTCGQSITDSLFLPDAHIKPMSIEENIKYIEAQEKMVLAYLEIEESVVGNSEKELYVINAEISDMQKEIRSIKKDLIADERLPSIAEIERGIKLKSKLEFYYKTKDELCSKLEIFYHLSKEWQKIIEKEKSISKNFLSSSDFSKIDALEKYFLIFLEKYGYTSKNKNAVSLSKVSDKQFLLPMAESKEIGVKYDLRFDSSGSDFVRSLWSYYCALYRVAQEKETNHPKLLIFDEPAQQEVANDSFNKLLLELENYTDGQVLVFASFHQSEPDYVEMIKGLSKFHLIDIRDRSIVPKK